MTFSLLLISSFIYCYLFCVVLYLSISMLDYTHQNLLVLAVSFII
jgi:hypothetical protein